VTAYLSHKIKIVSLFAILLVVIQHAINFTGYIDPNSSFIGKASFNTIVQYVFGYGFSRIAVYLFFSISGYLFFQSFTLKMYAAKVRSRIRSLLVPYLVWSTIGLIVVIILQTLFTDSGYFSVLYTGEITGKPFLSYLQMVLQHGVSFQLWFLRDLMLYTLLAPLFYIVIRFSSLLFLVPAYILWLANIQLPPVFSFLYRGGLFYLLGAYIAIQSAYMPEKNIYKIWLFSACSWIFLIIIKTTVAFGLLPSTWLSLQQLDNMGICLGLSTIWFGYDALGFDRYRSTLLPFTTFTFFIYASHEPLLEILKRIGFNIARRSELAQLCLYVATIIGTLGIVFFIGFLLRKYLPKVYALLIGGR